MTTVSTTKGSDTSLVGRAFDDGGTPYLLQILLASLAAFGTGALIQRVLLGEYGITVGPVSIPTLPPVTQEDTQEASDLIDAAPEIKPIRMAGAVHPQDPPLFRSIDDAVLRRASIRVDLELRLRRLSTTAGIDPDVPTSKIPGKLRAMNILSEAAADGVRKLLSICDRLVAGAEIDDASFRTIETQATHVMYVLDELEERLRTNATSSLGN